MKYEMKFGKWFNVAASLLAVCTITFLVFSKPIQWPTGDAPRYIIIGLNLLEHGVISRQPFNSSRTPREQLPIGGPLVAWEIAAAAALNPKTRDSLICSLEARSCSYSIPGLRALHALELILFAASGGVLAAYFFQSSVMAWGTVGLILLCKQMYEGAELAITEPLFLACAGVFLLSWYRWLSAPSSMSSAFAVGLTLSLTTLVKPVFITIIPIAPFGIIIFGLWCGRPVHWSLIRWTYLSYFFPCFVLVGGYMGYHASFSGHWALSDPMLLEAALAQRVSYNAMTWNEWFAGWIYYLPDFGDSLAQRFIDPEYWKRLNLLDPGGFFIYGRDVLHQHVQELAAPKLATRILLIDYLLANPIWHAITSLLLLWSGIFVGKLWGLVAFPCVIWCLSQCRKNKQAILFLGILTPMLVVAGIYSSCSLSIARYNSGLIIPFALAMVWVARQILEKLFVRAR